MDLITLRMTFGYKCKVCNKSNIVSDFEVAYTHANSFTCPHCGTEYAAFPTAQGNFETYVCTNPKAENPIFSHVA